MPIQTEPITINLGPQHPSTHGVFRLRVTFDGEVVLDAEPVFGYLHRGTEKLAEERSFTQIVTLTDRLDYTASMTNNLAYVRTVEKLSGIEVPERASYLRVLCSELQRIASHLISTGFLMQELGTFGGTPLMYCFREREEVLKIFEKYCGARLTTHAFRIGGLLYETYGGFEKDCLTFCDWLEGKVDEYEALLTTNRIWLGRTKGVGILNAEDCKDGGVTGPVLRAAGVKWDIRKALPYSGYEKYDFEVPTAENGDTYDRYVVRIQEMRQSVRIIRQAVENLPSGPIKGKVGKILKPPIGEAYTSIEAPKGELGYFVVSDGSTQPYRIRVRPPSFVNLQALDKMCRGSLVADVVAIIGSLDIVLGEVDR